MGVLTDTKNGHWLLFEGIYGISRTNYVVVRDRLLRILKEFDLIIVPSRFEEMLYFITFYCHGSQKAVFLTEKDKEMLTSFECLSNKAKILNRFWSNQNQVERRVLFDCAVKDCLTRRYRGSLCRIFYWNVQERSSMRWNVYPLSGLLTIGNY